MATPEMVEAVRVIAGVEGFLAGRGVMCAVHKQLGMMHFYARNMRAIVTESGANRAVRRSR